MTIKPKKNVLITGGNSGIGHYLARKFSELGYNVFITVRVLGEKNIADNNIYQLKVDVRNADELLAAYRTLVEDFNVASLDVLINNAGIAVLGPIENLPIEQIIDQFDVNVFGVLRITKQFLPLLRAAKGKIINIGSTGARALLPFVSSYGASKAALKHFSWAMRIELKPWGIQTFHLETGKFDTPIWEKSFQSSEAINHGLYQPYIQNALSIARSQAANYNSFDVLWKVVKRICENKQARFNTHVGKDAFIRMLATNFLPNSILEKLVSKILKLYQKA